LRAAYFTEVTRNGRSSCSIRRIEQDWLIKLVIVLAAITGVAPICPDVMQAHAWVSSERFS
jgi:hypothetical protein